VSRSALTMISSFNPFVGVAHTDAGDLASEALVFVGVDAESDLQVADFVHEVFWSGEYRTANRAGGSAPGPPEATGRR
jgi:hypothetical protein